MQGREGAFREEAASSESVAAAGNAAELGVETVGTLDLGGSSLEVTFLPTGKHASEATSEQSSFILAEQTKISVGSQFS